MKAKMLLKTCLPVFLLCAGTYQVKESIILKAEQIAINEEHTHCICGEDFEADTHNDHMEHVYAPWSGGDFDYDGEDGNKGSAFLYLTEDVVNNINSCNRVDGDGILSIKAEQTLYLCLNGHSLKNGKIDSNVIDINANAKLVLCDCGSTGTIGGRKKGSSSGAIWLSSGQLDMYGGSLTGSNGVRNGGGIYAGGSSIVNIYGGKITNNYVTNKGGALFVTGTSIINMYGGEISHNNSIDNGGAALLDSGTTFNLYDGIISDNYTGNLGGAIMACGATVNMYNGSIVRNSATSGGGVVPTYLKKIYGTLNLYGGEIANNTAFAHGGGVYVWDQGILNLDGGKIINNNAGYGGGVSLYLPSNGKNVINLSKGVIQNNTAKYYGDGICMFRTSELNFKQSDAPVTITDNGNSNIYFVDESTITIEGMHQDSRIGLSNLVNPTKGSPITFYNSNETDYSGNFFTDSEDVAIIYNDNGLQFTADFYKATINYVTNSQDTIGSNVEKGFNEEINIKISEIVPSLACHRFLGWTDAENKKEVVYNSGDTILVKGEITLYALWEETSHNLSKVDKIEATCEENGLKEYYVCTECGKRFIQKDNEKVEITNDDELVILKGHQYGKWIEEQPASEESEGTKGHKDCDLCHKHFDENNNEIIDLTIPKLPIEPKEQHTSGATVGITIGVTTGSVLALEALAYLIVKFIKKRKISL